MDMYIIYSRRVSTGAAVLKTVPYLDSKRVNVPGAKRFLHCYTALTNLHSKTFENTIKKCFANTTIDVLFNDSKDRHDRSVSFKTSN